MTRYVLRKGSLVPVERAAPLASSGVQIMSDLKPFKSPLEGHPTIDGRAALREQLKRNECRIVEKGEWRERYLNPSFAAKRGLQLGD